MFEAVNMRKSNLGPDHIFISDSYYYIAKAYIDHQEYKNALAYLNKSMEVLKLIEKKENKNHQKSEKVQNNIEFVRKKLGEFK